MEQESQKRKLEETAQAEPQNTPILCANNCGFFGSPSTNHLCSKCYKDFLKQSKTPIEGKDVTIHQDESKTCSFQKIESPSLVHGGKDQGNGNQNEKTLEGAEPKKRPTNRCSCCRKRVGLTGFKCRCGDTFCLDHRYSDKHDCPYDYKSVGKDAIAKANPVVKADKIDKI